MRSKLKAVRVISSIAAACSVFSASVNTVPVWAATVDNSYIPGVYTGTGYGHGDEGENDINVTVTLEEQDGNVVISDIAAENETQTPRYWNRAAVLFDMIKENNGTDGIDAVSRATESSNGILEAVDEALEKARGSGIFAYGRGTAARPYIINSAEQLESFALSVDEGTDYAGQFIALDDDIDLSGIENWNPIGAEGNANSSTGYLFAGNFNGQGHIISGMTITGEYSEETNAGLFSTLASTAKIENINMKDTNINVSVSGDMVPVRAGAVTGDTARAGSRAAIINNCSASGNVTASAVGGTAFSGGIAGRIFTYSAVINSLSEVNASAYASGEWNASYAGGIAGMTGNNTVVANCASLGNIYSENSSGTDMDSYAGGIAGMLSSKLYNCYAAGDASIKRKTAANEGNVGILSGYLTASASEGDYNYFADDAEIRIISADDAETVTDTVGWFDISALDSGINDPTGISKTDMTAAEFADTLNGKIYTVNKALNEAALVMNRWEYNGELAVPSSEEWVNDTIDDSIFASGSGSEQDPYIIETKEQITQFAASLTDSIDYYEKYIELGADIDISGSDWEPIGRNTYPFDGSFNGAGHTISGLTEGTPDSPRVLDSASSHIALFGILGPEAVVKNVKLTDVYINVTSAGSARVAGIAGQMKGSPIEGTYLGAVIDSCYVSGEITSVQDDGNCFVGGLAGFNQKGAMINCRTDVKLSGTTYGEYIAEVGGLVGLLNRGLVANCYSLGDVYASGNRENNKEGMGAASSLVSVNGGTLAGCYSKGGHTTKELSTYTGAVSGWLTGIGKAYNCLYNEDAPMVLNGNTVSPVGAVGTIIPGGVSDDSDLVFAGGLTDKLESYTSETYKDIADKLNSYFAEYPADLSRYGLSSASLKKWVYDKSSGEVTFAENYAEVTYVQSEVEFIPEEELVYQDGEWYGRDRDKTTVVKITVENNEIVKTEVQSGEDSGEAYESALWVAEQKSAYGDFTDYEPADPSRFAGGTGTESDPYLIATEEQLRYIAEAINDDVDWHGTYFRQVADIELHGEFLPIGWAREVRIKNTWEILAYIFRGNYDGGNHIISGLTIGSADKPSVYFMAGLFGFTQGEWDNNLDPAEGTKPVTLKNTHLRDAYVNTANIDQTYAGTLLGDGQNGIVIDNCSATGTVKTHTDESHSRAAGLAASVLRGMVTDCWTDTEVYAETVLGRTYSGSMLSMTNRVSVLNCYTLGNASGRSDTYGVTWVGGIDSFAGGIKINCYSLGDEKALSATTGVGGINGLKGSISVDYLTYYNSEAEQSAAGIRVENKPTGDNLTTPKATDEGVGKTRAELTDISFAELLNANAADMPNQIKRVDDELEGFYSSYYKGDGTDLNRWTVKDGIVVFAEPADSFDIAQTADGKIKYKAEYDTVKVTDFYVAAYDAENRLIGIKKNAAEGEFDAENVSTIRAFYWNALNMPELGQKKAEIN